MKHIILLITAIVNLNCFGQDRFWEQLDQTEKQAILARNDVMPFAREFYNDRYNLGQDTIILNFLENLSKTKNDTIFPFYYFLFIKMCRKSDGYIGEVLGQCCINILLNHSNFVFNHLRLDKGSGKNSEYYIFRDNLIFEYYASGLENSFPDRPSFKKFELSLKKTTNTNNKELMTKLLSEVKSEAVKMIEGDKNQEEKLKQLELKAQ